LQRLKDWLRALLIAFTIVVVVKVFVFEIFTIPTSSMEKTLIPGDLILVNKLSYGSTVPFTNYKLPALTSIKRNDVVVFFYPMDDAAIISDIIHSPEIDKLKEDNLIDVGRLLLPREFSFVIKKGNNQLLKTINL